MPLINSIKTRVYKQPSGLPVKFVLQQQRLVKITYFLIFQHRF